MGAGRVNKAVDASEGQAAEAASYSPLFKENSKAAIGIAGEDQYAIPRQYYQSLASGDPTKLQSTLAPVIGDITKQTQATKDQIVNSSARGGTEQLALQMADVNKGSNIAQLTSQAYQSAFPNLERVATEDVNKKLAAYGLSDQALAGGVGATGTAGELYNKAAAVQAQKKGAQLGLIGEAGRDAATVGAAAV